MFFDLPHLKYQNVFFLTNPLCSDEILNIHCLDLYWKRSGYYDTQSNGATHTLVSFLTQCSDILFLPIHHHIIPEYQSLYTQSISIQLDHTSQSLEFLSKAPRFLSHKWVIINQAHRLSIPCQNQLLKQLEESHTPVVWIFLLPSPKFLLKTILSRGSISLISGESLSNSHKIPLETKKYFWDFWQSNFPFSYLQEDAVFYTHGVMFSPMNLASTNKSIHPSQTKYYLHILSFVQHLFQAHSKNATKSASKTTKSATTSADAKIANISLPQWLEFCIEALSSQGDAECFFAAKPKPIPSPNTILKIKSILSYGEILMHNEYNIDPILIITQMLWQLKTS
jgi:DNA polymerase III, delta subunit